MAGTLRLSTAKFHAGPGPGKPPLEIKPGTVVIFVGPNNSGKSLALREIENWCFGQDTVRKVIDSIEVDFPDDPAHAEQLLKEFESSPPPNQGPAPGHFWIGQHTFRQDQPVRHFQINTDQLRNAVEHKHNNVLRQWLAAFYTVRLDGRTRFSLSDPKPAGDLQQNPQNHLWALFKDDVARDRVRKLTEDAFGLHFVIDPTAMLQFRIGMSSRAPRSKNEEQSLDEVARTFHREAQAISELGDGVQAFVGLVSAVLSLRHKIILVDEPEAFLHPPLARRLAGSLAQISGERAASLIVATHSPEFLIGCLETADTSVVRLTYEAGTATARTLSSLELAVMTRDALLRSTGVLSALFHRGAVVTESDADRAFYDEMNRRLLSANRGIRDAVFLQAQNRQTIHRIVGPLRHIGIPAAAIVDLDILEDGGTDWKSTLDACQIPPNQRAHLEAERKYLANVFPGMPKTRGAKPIKNQGLSGLGVADRRRAKRLLKKLSAYGLYLIPNGELESWLPHLRIRGHGPRWLVNAFSQIGRSEGDTNYLEPGSGDVWQFLDEIASWVNDSQRLGTD